MKHLFLVLSLFLCIQSAAAMEIMKLSQVKPGMEGEGKTIFKGTKIESFTFKVLGVVEKFAPDKNMIIVELNSPELNEGGVIAGMSGSPAYIDGKLIGSVSYGFPFSKKPIAGITPIEDILRVDECNTPSYSVDISNIKIDFTKQGLVGFGAQLLRTLTSRGGVEEGSTFQPIRLLGLSRGFRSRPLETFAPLLAPLQSGKLADQISSKPVDPALFRLEPADAVAIPLVRGDFEFSASGTVTHVDGNKVYAFGHPFFNLGTVNLPLHKAEVITVVPTLDNPFKLAATRQQIGVVQQDRFSAVQGELGKSPTMIPLKVFVRNRNRNFNLEVVNHPLLTGALVYISLMNIFDAEFQQMGVPSLAVKGKIFIENAENIVIDDFFCGNTAFDDFANLMNAVNFFLLNNKDRPIRLQKIDLELNVMESVRRSELENVLLEKSSFLPGELLNIGLILKNERGETVEDKITIKAPNLKPGSEFYLMAADAAEMVDFDTKVTKAGYFPSRLDALIRAINNLRKNNRLYFKIFVPSDGLFVRGYEYSNLPASVNNMLTYNSAAKDQADILFSTIGEYQYEIPAAVSGKKIFKLTIKERKNAS